MNKIYFIITAVFFFIYSIRAQQQTGPFIAYGQESKFLAAQNYCVYQTPNGYLWIANQNGLVRFDGRHYKHYAADYTKPNSPSDNTVVDIAADKNGDIWFCGFSNGLTKYNERTGKFTKYAKPTKDNFQFYGVNAILNDSDNNLWFATAGRGLAQYLFNKDSFVLYYPEPKGCKDGSIRGDNYTTGICADRNNGDLLWVTSYKGLYAFNKKTKLFTHFPLDENKAHNTELTFNNCDADAAGNLWLGSWGKGLYCFSTITKKFIPQKKYKTPAIVSHVKIINDSILMAACFGKGLYQLNLNTGSYADVSPQTDAEAVKKVSINKISVTQDAGIFIGGNNYIYQLHPSFTRLKKNITYQFDGKSEQLDINSFVWDAAKQQYWIATSYGNGLYALRENESVAKQLASMPTTVAGQPNIYKHLIIDAKNRIWVINYFNGVYVWNENAQQFEKPSLDFTTLPAAVFNNIKSLQTDSKGNVWLLSGDSLIYYNVPKEKYEVFAIEWGKNFKGPKKYNPAVIKFAPDGNVWLLTQSGFFVCNVSQKKVQHIYETGSTRESLPSAFIEAGDFNIKFQNFWITSGGLLHVYNWKNYSVLSAHTIANGMPSSTVKDIKSDDEGRVWVSTLAGLAFFDPAKKMWRSFNRFDGLEDDYLDGNLFIVNNKIVVDQKTGFVFKSISDAGSSAAMPQLRFTAITVNNKVYNDTLPPAYCTGLNLSFNENNISIEFAAMDWLYPFKTNYLYKIDDGKKQQNYSSTAETTINLLGLSPGSYKIYIKAISGSGVWSNEIVLPITINRPFWLQAWFIILCVLLFAALLYALYRYRINQLKKLQVMRNNISRNLHDDIGASLSNINILTELAKRNVANPEKSNEYLEKVGEDIQHISESLSDIVWNINTKYDDIEQLFIRMKRYAADMMDGKNISYTMVFPENAEKVVLPMEKRGNLYLIFKEAINNLVKYSKTASAAITVTADGKKIMLDIKDFGTGFDLGTASYGNGITNMRQRALASGAHIEITSKPGLGTQIILQMPIT